MTPRPVTRRLLLLFCAAATCAIAGAATGPATASAALGIACPNPTAQVFLPWGDSFNYALAPNGGFEQAATGWALRGRAAVVSGSEPFRVAGGSGRHSLAISAGGAATSPPICIGLLSTRMRLFVRNTGDPAARLQVRAIYRGGLGEMLGIFDAGSIGAGGTWQPSQRFTLLGGVVPLLTQSVEFRFSSPAPGSSWRIDDLYLDPLKHR